MMMMAHVRARASSLILYDNARLAARTKMATVLERTSLSIGWTERTSLAIGHDKENSIMAGIRAQQSSCW